MANSDKNVSYQPTDGLCYDPADPRYWSADLLAKEVTRVFEVCNGCRMCFKYCDSFPSLFDALDKRRDGDVRKLTAEDVALVMDGCFQCKLCEVTCPYTPRDKHEFQLDFPKLVHRYNAQRTKSEGLSLRDRVLGNPDGLGRLGRATFGLANVMNRVKLHRWFLEKLLGVHRDKQLPPFASTTFERWADGAGRMAEPPAPGAAAPEVVLFQTCYVQNNDPELGRDTLEVYDRNQIPTKCTRGLACCGMPAWEHGDLDTLRANAKTNLDRLLPFVEAGAKVVVLQPTCAMMLRREYPELVAPEDRPRAEKLAAAVADPSEYLWSIRNQPRFDTAYASGPPGGRIAYHAPCHLRAQSVGFRGRDLVRKLPGVQAVHSVTECCGHDGTFAMTTEGFEASVRVGTRAFDGMRDGTAEVWVTDCSLAAIQFAQHAGVRPMHPMTALAKAYRPNGFGTTPALPGPTIPEGGGGS